MRSRMPFSSIGLLVAGSLLVGLAPRAHAQNHQVDPVHSSVVFSIQHMGAGWVFGRFNDVSGTFNLSGNRSSVSIEVKTASVDTGNQRRDEHLRSPDFLNARQFPVMSFKSQSVRKINNNTYEVKGNLTLHGVTRPLTVRVRHAGTGKNPQGKTINGFEATFAVKRTDFGMTNMVGPAGDQVRVIIAAEGAAG